MANHIKVKAFYPHEELAARKALEGCPEFEITFALFGLAQPDGYEIGTPPDLDADADTWNAFSRSVARAISAKREHAMPQIEEAVGFARLGKSEEDVQQEQLERVSAQVKQLRSSGLLSPDQIDAMVASFTTSFTGRDLGADSDTMSE